MIHRRRELVSAAHEKELVYSSPILLRLFLTGFISLERHSASYIITAKCVRHWRSRTRGLCLRRLSCRIVAAVLARFSASAPMCLLFAYLSTPLSYVRSSCIPLGRAAIV